MKNVICVLLMCAFAAPVIGQRVKHDRKHVEAAHKKADVKKGCPKCNSLKKELEALKKRVARSQRGSRRGGRSIRGRSSRGTRGKRGTTTKKSNDTQKKMEAARKKWAEAMKKRVDSSNKKRDGEWRKRIEEMRKTFQLQLRDGRFIAKSLESIFYCDSTWVLSTDCNGLKAQD